MALPLAPLKNLAVVERMLERGQVIRMHENRNNGQTTSREGMFE
jgi:hypothetical protein